jgi:hypothetical protein
MVSGAWWNSKQTTCNIEIWHWIWIKSSIIICACTNAVILKEVSNIILKKHIYQGFILCECHVTRYTCSSTSYRLYGLHIKTSTSRYNQCLSTLFRFTMNVTQLLATLC